MPLLSKSSWVDYIGVVGDEAARAGAAATVPRPSKPATRAPVIPSATGKGAVRRPRTARKNLGPISHSLSNTYPHLLKYCVSGVVSVYGWTALSKVSELVLVSPSVALLSLRVH